MLHKKDSIMTAQSGQQVITGTLRLDKLPIASIGSNGQWKRHKETIFNVIKALLGNVLYCHEGKCTTDGRFKRHRTYLTKTTRIDIFHGKRMMKMPNGEKRFSIYAAVVRITTRDLSGEHVRIALEIERLLDRLGFPHFLGTRRDHAEIAFDTDDYDSWLNLEKRSLWRWTKPGQDSFYDAISDDVIPGFDALGKLGAQSHYTGRPTKAKPIARRFAHSYVDLLIEKFRNEMRLNRDALRALGIETVSDLVRESEKLMRRYLSVWEADIAKILRFRRKCERDRKHAAIYRRTPGYFERLVREKTTAEVLAILQSLLPSLKPYEIRQKCFRKADVTIVMRPAKRAFKSVPQIPRIGHRNSENDIEKYRRVASPVMHEQSPGQVIDITSRLFPEMVKRNGEMEINSDHFNQNGDHSISENSETSVMKMQSSSGEIRLLSQNSPVIIFPRIDQGKEEMNDELKFVGKRRHPSVISFS